MLSREFYRRKHRFKDLFQYQHASKTLLVSGSRRTPDSTTLETFIQGENPLAVQSMTIENVYGLKEAFFISLSKSFSNLTELSIPNNASAVTDAVLNAISKNLKHSLKRLNIRCSYCCTTLDSLFQMMNLSCLNVSQCSEAKIDVTDLATLSWNSKDTLTSLDLSYCGKFYSVSLFINDHASLVSLERDDFGSSGALGELFSEYRKLQVLNLQGLPDRYLTDNTFEKIAGLYFLESLNLSECPRVLQHLGFLDLL